MREGARRARSLRSHPPQRAVEQPLAAVVAQAHQLIAGDRHRAEGRGARACARCRRGGWHCGRPGSGRSRARAADRNRRVEPLRSRRRRPGVSVAALAHSIESCTIGSFRAWRCISVSMASGSAAVKNPPPWIGGSCAGSPSTSSGGAERQEIAAELVVDHRAFVDDDELRLGGGPLVPRGRSSASPRRCRAPDRSCRESCCRLAALAAHHRSRLAGEGAEQDACRRHAGQCAWRAWSCPSRHSRTAGKAAARRGPASP